MKRLMPSGLISFLQDNPNCVRADLFTISLPNGESLLATSGQFNITVPDSTPGLLGGETPSGQVAGWLGGFDSTAAPAYTTESGTGLPTGAAARTMCAFVRSTLTTRQGLFGYGAGTFENAFVMASGIGGSGNAYFIGYGADITGTANICDGVEHHVAVTYDGTTAKIYVDGVLDSSNTLTLNTTSTSFIIGQQCYPDAGPTYYTSSAFIRDVRVYDSALTAAQITSIASPGVTYSASQWGNWSRGAITSDASFDLHSNTMELTCVPQLGTTYPGASTGLLNAALNGLFDACEITVQTVYMPFGHYGNVSNGVETKFRGQITKINDISRNKVVFECADYLYLLNVKVPTRIIQANCPWGFADANCSLTASTYTTTFTAASGSTSWVMTPTSAFTQPTGYFTQGVVKCLTGANNGLSQAVKLHDASGNLNVTYPWLFPVAAGDTFSVIAGCDKSATTCVQKFNNLVHFGGMPFVPPPQAAL